MVYGKVKTKAVRAASGQCGKVQIVGWKSKLKKEIYALL